MRSINQAIILGNLTRDPELRYTPNGDPVISFGIATNRYWTTQTGEKKEAVEFHNIIFWGKPAEILDQYVSKGDKLYIQGRLQTREWEGKDGVKRRSTEIVGRDFILLSPKPEGESPKGKPVEPPTDTTAGSPVKGKEPKRSANEKVEAEDLPF